MSNYNELVTILKELLFNRFYPRPEYIRGLLGDGRGNVLVPGRVDYNYVRFSRASTETFEVFNKEVSQPVDGWPILVGEFPWQPGLVQVVATDWSAYAQTGWGDSVASIQAHAPTHEWPNFAPGSDSINTYLRAITPMRTQAAGSGSASVIVTAYEYDGATGSNYNWPGLPPFNLQPATPPTGSMRYMGVYLNPTTNTLGVVTGSTTIYTDALEPDRPQWPIGVFPSAYVRLYGGQAAITERDVRDARRLWESTLVYTGSLGPHNLLSQFHPDTLPGSVVAGDLIYGNSTPKWTRLPIVTGSFLGSGAGAPAWGPLPYASQAEVDAGTNPAKVVAPSTYAASPRFLPCNGRLSLTTGVAVTTSDVTAATTIYFTPFQGNRIALYDGTRWLTHAFTERSLSLSGFAANQNNDVFIFHNAGTLTLERVAWTNDSTRATALTTQDGVLVKSGEPSKRYLGTFRTTGTTGQCEDSTTHRYVWNNYNRVRKYLTIFNGSNHTYDSTWRAFNGDQANSDVEIVVGLVEEIIDIYLQASMTFAAGGSSAQIGPGLNSLTSPLTQGTLGIAGTLRIGYVQTMAFPSLGYNYIVILEQGGNTGADPAFNNATLTADVTC